MSDIEREAFDRIERQFTSLNGVGTERASIRSDDWENAKRYLQAARAGGEPVAQVVETDQADEIGASVVIELNGAVLLPGDTLYAQPPSRALNPIQADALNVMERYKQSFGQLYTHLGQFLDQEEGEGGDVNLEEAWAAFNRAPGPVYWSKIEAVIKTADTHPPAKVPEGEWRKRVSKWSTFLASLKTAPIPKSQRRTAEGIRKEVDRYLEYGLSASPAKVPEWVEGIEEIADGKTQYILGWWEEWPERAWRQEIAIAGQLEGIRGTNWLHGRATHYMAAPTPPQQEGE